MSEASRQQDRHKRIRLVKRLLRPLPRRTNLHRYPILKWFAEGARRRAYLWSFRVNAMSPAFYVGSVISLLPIMGVQIPVAFLAALLLRANLPAMIGLQLVTNAFTFVAIYAGTQQVGRMVNGYFDINGPAIRGGALATNLVIGGLICGLLLGFVLDIVYRFLAYEAGRHHWHLPRRKRGAAEESASPDDPDGHKN